VVLGGSLLIAVVLVVQEVQPLEEIQILRVALVHLLPRVVMEELPQTVELHKQQTEEMETLPAVELQALMKRLVTPAMEQPAELHLRIRQA
jgi:hypothetical protein